MAEEKKKPGRPAGSKNKSNSKSKIASKEKEKQEYLKKVTGSRLRDEIWSIIMVAFGIFLAISVQTEAAGQLGLFIKEVLLGSFGA
ncbi:MAG: hypothetical protein RRY25_08305, partial [Anaerovorax sp.]